MRFSSAKEFFKAGKLPSKRFLNYTIERFGLTIGPYPAVGSKGRLRTIKDSKSYLNQPSYWYERPDYLVQVWRTRIFPSPIAHIGRRLSDPLTSRRQLMMYFEERWHPSRGTFRSLHWSAIRDSNNSKIDLFKRDALILDGISRIGRPPGTKKLNVRDAFILKYKEARSIAKRNGNLDQDFVAHELGISVSTLYRRLRDYHLKWSRKNPS